MTSYNAFLNLKERSGQERALMTGVFTANQFEAAQYPLFLSHIAAQTAYLHIYNDYASEVLKKRYQQALETPAFLQVETMRKVAIEKAFSGDFGIEPTAWFASMTSRINSMHEIEKELAEQIKSLADQKSNQAKRTLIMISLLGMVILTVSIGFSYWVCSSITSAVKMLNSTIGQIQRNKDLTLGLPVLGNDEIGQVAAALNGLMDNFRQSIGQVTISALNVLQCSESIASTSSQLASGTSHLSNSAAAMAVAIEEMGASIEQVADNAKQVQVITAESSELSELGTNVILKVETEMNGIADAVRQASVKMQELDEQSTEINSIIQVIREIADQTNLLALNASIEAARAGEQGRGFAVVADEVRSLSARTTNSAQEIATMIHKMQTVTRDAVTSMNIGVEKVNNEVTTTHNAGESIKKIQSASQQVTIAVMDICNAISEQSKASHEIGRQVERVAQMSEESYAASNSNAETAKEMKVLASHLQTIVASFKVGTL
jgi:methyl-accepting chemotaxis protein